MNNNKNNNFNDVFKKDEIKIKPQIEENIKNEISDVQRIEVTNPKMTKRSILNSNANINMYNLKSNLNNNNFNRDNDKIIEENNKNRNNLNSLENENGYENNNVVAGFTRNPILNKMSGYNLNNNNNFNNNNNEIKTYSDNERFKKSSVREINKKPTSKNTEKDQSFKIFEINENLEIEEPRSKKTFNAYGTNNNNNNNNVRSDLIIEKYFQPKKQKLSFSVSKLFSQLLCPFCYKNSKMIQLKKKVFYSFMKRNFDKTDMIYIQNPMRYLDILIHLVLDDRHIALLENVSRERFYFDCDNEIPSFVNKLSI